MKIAIDFDETITEDPDFWSDFINLARRHFHEVTIVTFRRSDGYNDDITNYANDHNINVVYTAGVQKANVFKADVWIDDSPVTIPGKIALFDMYRGCNANGE